MNESYTHRSSQSNLSLSQQSHHVIIPVMSLMLVVSLMLIMTTFVAF